MITVTIPQVLDFTQDPVAPYDPPRYQDALRMQVAFDDPTLFKKMKSLVWIAGLKIRELRLPDQDNRSQYFSKMLIDLSEHLINNDGDKVAKTAIKTLVYYGYLDVSLNSPYFIDNEFQASLIPDTLILGFINTSVNNPELLEGLQF